MQILNSFFAQRKLLVFFVHLLLVAIAPAALRAQELYHLDFSPSDVGTYQVTAGSPVIQAGAGPFSNALVFNAVTTGEQILLPIEVSAPEYELQFDVLPQGLANARLIHPARQADPIHDGSSNQLHGLLSNPVVSGQLARFDEPTN
jgi:hypothetical protein